MLANPNRANRTLLQVWYVPIAMHKEDLNQIAIVAQMLIDTMEHFTDTIRCAWIRECFLA